MRRGRELISLSLCLSRSLALSHACTCTHAHSHSHTHIHTHTHTHIHTYTHTHTHTHSIPPSLSLSTPGMRPSKQEATYEEGTYCYCDLALWRSLRKSTKEFHVEYDKLEDRPQMPSNLLASSGLTAPA